MRTINYIMLVICGLAIVEGIRTKNWTTAIWAFNCAIWVLLEGLSRAH